MQRELEDVKKVKNKEMNQLKAEIVDLKSELEHERAKVGQSCIQYCILSGFNMAPPAFIEGSGHQLLLVNSHFFKNNIYSMYYLKQL